MPTATDSKRVAKAHTPVSSLVFRQISGREELSRLFEYKLELIAEDDKSIDPKALLGRSIVAEILIQGGGSRYINGECVRFSYAGAERAGERNTTLWRYDAVLRPWLWYATRTSTCKIWQKMTVPDIVKAVLAKYPFSTDWRISRPYREWNYCVQYEETDFNFVSRLLEHEGIYYWFEHSIGACTLVLADDMGAHLTLPGYGTIPFMLSDMMARPDEEWIDDWHMVQEVDSGRYVTDDYYYRTPSAELKVERQKPLGFPWDDQEVYEWPGGYTEPSPWGEQYAQTRIEELQQSKEIVSGRSNVRGLTPGYLFTLERSQRYDQDRQYLVRSVSMYFRDNAYTTGGSPTDWQFVFEAQPLDFPYRPPRLTRKPLINGPQTAVVTGPEHEEIYTDDEGLGRVKVWFPWDREKDVLPQDRSCWIRVSSSWAGSNWGQISLPRVGQEVIVEYIDGDPDYPIITGRCYNQEHKPPYELPKYKEYSTIKSHSTKKGGPMEWNELRFYDYKGKEQVFIHCQWRLDIRVKWNAYQTVRESLHYSTWKSHYHTIGGDYHLYIRNKLFEHSKSEMTVTTKDAVKFVCQGVYQFTTYSAMEVNAFDSITLESQTAVTLRVGGNYITVDQTGVTIQGFMTKINCGGEAKAVQKFEAKLPHYASESDDGTPGYLDRPPRTGGGGWKEESMTGGVFHAPDVVIKRGNVTIKITKPNKTITLEGTQEYSGDGATQAYADKASANINKAWSGPVKYEGEDYQATADIKGKVRGPYDVPDPNATQVNVVKTDVPPSVTGQTDPANQPFYGNGTGHQHSNQDDDGTQVIAHEFGHSMGLKDEYEEGPRNADGTRNVRRTGPDGGLMGHIESDSKPTQDNWDSLLTGKGLAPKP